MIRTGPRPRGAGLTANPADLAEAVRAPDFNVFVAGGFSPWRDFTNNGFKDAGDLNVIIGHLLHDCDTPMVP